jgi:hypothetical protein
MFIPLGLTDTEMLDPPANNILEGQFGLRR